MRDLFLEIMAVRGGIEGASWEFAKGALNMMLRVYGSAPSDINSQGEYDHLERCVKKFVEAVEECRELEIVEDAD